MATGRESEVPADQAGTEQKKHRRDYRVAGVGGLAGGVLVAVITLIATFSTSHDETARQLRQIKQTQYAATYSAIGLEAQSYSRTLADFQRDDAVAAFQAMRGYQGQNDVVQQLDGLPLVADSRVLRADLDFIDKRGDFLAALGAVARAYDAGGKPNQAQLQSAAAKFAAARSSEAGLLLAMRQDLNIP